MTKKEYLQQYQNIDKQIKAKNEQYAKVFSLAAKITPTYSDMPKAHNSSDKIQTAVDKLDQIETELVELLKQREYIRENIIMSAMSTNDTTAYKLITYRYIKMLSWQEIAKLLQRDNVDYVRQDLHRKAIEKIQLFFR